MTKLIKKCGYCDQSFKKKDNESKKVWAKKSLLKKIKNGTHNWYKHGRCIASKRSKYQKEWAKDNIEKRRYYCRDYRARKNVNGGSHTEEQWLELKEKYNNMCLCCKQQEPQILLTKDHIMPISLGGKNSIDNIQPLCLSCNCSKWATKVDYRNTKQSQ